VTGTIYTAIFWNGNTDMGLEAISMRSKKNPHLYVSMNKKPKKQPSVRCRKESDSISHQPISKYVLM